MIVPSTFVTPSTTTTPTESIDAMRNSAKLCDGDVTFEVRMIDGKQDSKFICNWSNDQNDKWL